MTGRVVGLMTVRDEEDILEESLSHAASMYDDVLVVDCGSLDGSSKIIESMSRRHEKINFMGKTPPATPEQIKRHIWRSFRRRMRWRDWWCFADADEFVEPGYRKTLLRARPHFCDHAFGESVNFYYKNSEYERDAAVPVAALRADSIRKRRRFYRYHTSQIRFFRNLPWIRWDSDTATPSNLSCPASDRIRFYHYQYRDPKQLKVRISIRRQEYHNSDPSNLHWLKDSVQDALSDDADPTLRYLEDGAAPVRDDTLPSQQETQPHLKSAAKYAYNMLYGIGSCTHTDKLPTDQTKSTLIDRLKASS